MKVEEFKIKGMICSRCVKVLTIELRNTGAEILEIQLGRIVIKYDSKLISRTKIIDSICENDFEIIKDPRLILSEQIKKWVIYYVWNTFHEEKLSNYLERKLNKSYNLISKNFHESVGMSIDRYQVILKIERTKELLEEGQLSFSEIAYSVGYQSLSALSKQFKKETEMTLKEYKNLEVGTRVPLDKI
ncbi:AraC family transcriptional regulator [bacterium]|nr:AraC family transcriptional regulator [bacterium]